MKRKKLEPEMRRLLKAMTAKPPKKWIKYHNAQIVYFKASGLWDTLENLYFPGEMGNLHDALINWKDPKHEKAT